MKLPAKLALVASAGTLMVAGLTVGTGFASTVRDSGADSVRSTDRTTPMVSLGTSLQTNLLGAIASQGNDVQSHRDLSEDQFVRGRFGDQLVNRTENLQSRLRAQLDSGETQDQMDMVEDRMNDVLNGERPAGGPQQSASFRHVTQVVADALGMEVADVVALVKEGKTLAQIITDNNGDKDAIVDTQLEQLRERLQEKVDSGDITQEQMDQRLDKAEERINAVLNGERPSGGPHKSGNFRQVTKAVANALGMEVADVVALVKEGKTLAQIITDNDGDKDAIVDTQLEQLRERLQEKVDSGDITQEQMDQRLDMVEDRMNDVLNGERPSGVHKGKGRSRGRARGEDQRFRPRRGGDTQIDSEATAL